MSQLTLQAIIRWQRALGITTDIDITFHGGEPLLAGAKFYRTALPLLRDSLAPRQVRFFVQSNLWLLTDELCQLFRRYGVLVGTSLDGPEQINDAQRRQGYFRHTTSGIERARSYRIPVGCVCTFTPQSAYLAKEIFHFFASQKLPFTIQPASASLRSPQADEWRLSPKEYTALITEMLDLYLANSGKVRIATLDALCRSISAGSGGVCTFGDCLGHHLAIGPGGEIYPCQRFIGMPEYQLGDVHQCPSLDALQSSQTWNMFLDRQNRIEEECGDCPNIDFCRGGCPYDVLAENDGTFEHTLRDPQCAAYRHIFGYIADRAMGEVFSQENMDCVVSHADPAAGLLRQGRLLGIMRKKS